MKKINTTNTTATNNMGNGKVKKPFYKHWKFWMVMFAACAICNAGKFNKGVQDGLKANSTQSSVEQEDENQENKAAELSINDEALCRALTKTFVENVVDEKYSMFDFNVKEFELDENGNGTIKILYMPSNEKDGATKVNLTISKNGKVYKIEYALLDGLYEVDLSTIPNNYIEIIDASSDQTDMNQENKAETEVTQTTEVTEEATAATEEATAEAAEEDNIPEEYKSALKKAQTYSNIMHMSKAGLYNQLTSEYGEQFTEEAAQYAIDNVDADWSANALAKAKDYDGMHMSKAGLFNQLTSEYGEQFTAEEAQYAVDNVNFDWYSNALESAKLYQESMNMSPAAIYDQLTSEYGDKFTSEEAEYAIENLDK